MVARAALVACACIALLAGPPARAAQAPVASATLLAQEPSPARDKALARWARKAPLHELIHVLRLPSARLGRAEAPLLEAALALTHKDRVALKRRLLARLVRVAPDAKAARSRAAAAAARDVPRPFGSVFVVGAVLPDSGDYESDGRGMLAGLVLGLADSSALPVDVVARSSGSDEAVRAIAAFDALPVNAGMVVGVLLSVPTLVLAAASRGAGLPLISPAAPDESVGSLGRDVFQIGPAGFDRGLRLAAVVLEGKPLRVGLLRSSAAPAGFADGFAAAAESAGAHVAWRETYAPGNLEFREAVAAVQEHRLELLFWDGEAREAEALARALAKQRLAVRLCGGPGLAPEQHHSNARALFEGATYIAHDWEAGPTPSALLAAAPGGREAVDLRGWLAGRTIRAALAAGALCPEEVADQLRIRTGRAAPLRSRGFLLLEREGVTLPVYRVARGQSVAR